MTAAMHSRNSNLERPDALVDTRGGGLIILLLSMLTVAGTALAVLGSGAIALLLAVGVVAFVILAAAAI